MLQHFARFWRLFLSVMWSIIVFFLFFLFYFFSRFFLIFKVTSDWVLNQLRTCIDYTDVNGSEIELSTASCRKKCYFRLYVIVQFLPGFPLAMLENSWFQFSCTYIELWMHYGSLESTHEARVSWLTLMLLVLSKLPKCIHNSMYAR